MPMERPRAGQLGHTCIRVTDIDQTVRFYNGLLGMPIVERRDPEPPGNRMAALGSQENYLEVFQIKPEQQMESAEPQTLRLNHICLWVEGMEELEKRAAAAGSPFLNPIRSSPSWVGAAIKVGWVVDPDGNRVELLEWTGPAEVTR
ncbi:MAG TPA: VOC family protein [Chloroflexota bacterium]|jgi:catechol 2,3-dioxygenase-like lactoylglutathione lyase family enzyme|nr:VOC family protein [Chloroflexota bacterium]